MVTCKEMEQSHHNISGVTPEGPLFTQESRPCDTHTHTRARVRPHAVFEEGFHPRLNTVGTVSIWITKLQNEPYSNKTCPLNTLRRCLSGKLTMKKKYGTPLQAASQLVGGRGTRSPPFRRC